MNDASLGPDEVQALVDAVHEARGVVLEVYGSGFDVERKADESPVTEADRRAEAVIVAALRTITPGVPVVAEEAVAAGGAAVAGERFWLVDPLDGTREFVARNGEFTINAALIVDGRPVLGVVDAPALARTFVGIEEQGAWVEDAAGRRAITCRKAPPQGLTVLASRSHHDGRDLDAFLRRYRVAQIRRLGSSLKLCLIASGEADLYARLGRTMEWDIAAGHAVLAAAGGAVRDLEGTPLRYGKAGFESPAFVAEGRPRSRARGPRSTSRPPPSKGEADPAA